MCSLTIKFTVLGAVRAWRGDTELRLGPPQQRAVLALLLAAGGQPVSLSELVDLLWAADPPASAANIVHRYIGALRRVLWAALGDIQLGGAEPAAARASFQQALAIFGELRLPQAEEVRGRLVALGYSCPRTFSTEGETGVSAGTCADVCGVP